MNVRIAGVLGAMVFAATACGAADASGAGLSLTAGSEVASIAQDGGAFDDVTSTDAIDSEGQLLLFAECIRAEGFEIDDPTVDAEGNVVLPRPTENSGTPGPPEGFIDARDACAQHIEGVTLGFQGGDQTELQDQLLEFTACVRENGFDLADPDFSSAGGGRGLLQQADQDDPAYQAAAANCDLGGFRGGRGGAGAGD